MFEGHTHRTAWQRHFAIASNELGSWSTVSMKKAVRDKKAPHTLNKVVYGNDF